MSVMKTRVDMYREAMVVMSPSPTRRSRWLATGWQSDQMARSSKASARRSSSEAFPLVTPSACLYVGVPSQSHTCNINITWKAAFWFAEFVKYQQYQQYHISTQPISASRRHDVTSLCAATIGLASNTRPELPLYFPPTASSLSFSALHVFLLSVYFCCIHVSLDAIFSSLAACWTPPRPLWLTPPRMPPS